MKSTKGFTLVEMLVVVGLPALLMAAMPVSPAGAQKRAQIAKAESEVKVIHQAILGAENYDRKHELPAKTDQDVTESSLKEVFGETTAEPGGKVPTTRRASLSASGERKDPWGTTYKVSIKPGGASIRFASGTGQLQSGCYVPNDYRLSAEERQ